MAVLQGKVALVTGGSRGIGRAICMALAEAGAAVAFTYREQKAAADATLADLRELSGGRALAFQADVRDRPAVRACVAAVEAAFGGLDILVNNAGMNKPGDFDQVSDESWDEILDVNLKGPFICMQEALPALRRRGGGSIVNISSVSGQYGGPRSPHYAASKAGLISLGQCMARFGAKDGIRCNTVAPGFVQSEMAASGSQSPMVKKLVENNILLGRMCSPEEVAGTVVFLASDGASYITAQTVNVNGGLYF